MQIIDVNEKPKNITITTNEFLEETNPQTVGKFWIERCWEPIRASKMELFVKIANGFQLFTIFARSSILDIWQVSKYALLISN